MTAWVKRARENAEKALALAPELGEAHVAMALVLERGYLELRRANAEYERALALSPNDASVLMRTGRFLVTMGRTDAGLEDIRRGVALDQLNPQSYALLSFALTDAKQYHESNAALDRSLQIDANSSGMKNARGLNFLRLGEIDAARQSCESEQRDWQGRLCMAIVYEKLRRHAEAEAERAAFELEFGAGAAYQQAEIYAQWGNLPKALEWLEAAYRLPDPGIISLRVDALVDPLRREPRFQEIEHKLNFPN
jgi:Tfp pilus assembly protein PilF